jgi:hypothetical protein
LGAGRVTADIASKTLNRAFAEGRTLPATTRALIERALDVDLPAEVRG